jgi:hypothetical protein
MIMMPNIETFTSSNIGIFSVFYDEIVVCICWFTEVILASQCSF